VKRRAAMKASKGQQFIADVVGIAVKMRVVVARRRAQPLPVIRVSVHVLDLFCVVFDSLREGGAIAGPFPFCGLSGKTLASSKIICGRGDREAHLLLLRGSSEVITTCYTAVGAATPLKLLLRRLKPPASPGDL
jgi:hypothetical protein